MILPANATSPIASYREKVLESKLLNVESALEAARKRVFELEQRHVALMREFDEAIRERDAAQHEAARMSQALDDARMELHARCPR